MFYSILIIRKLKNNSLNLNKIILKKNNLKEMYKNVGFRKLLLGKRRSCFIKIIYYCKNPN